MYLSIHITGHNSDAFVSKTISPVGMCGDYHIPVWKISVEGKIELEFSGAYRKTLKIMHVIIVRKEKKKMIN